jgi:DNA-binding XRE family transcriptional regulator
MTTQIVEIFGHKMAVLPIDEYERLLEIVEDRAEIVAAETAEHRRDEGEEYLPSEMVDRILSGESRLRVWREHRNLTQKALAKLAGTSNVTISRLESGERIGNRRLWVPIAKALAVSVDDLLPID